MEKRIRLNDDKVTDVNHNTDVSVSAANLKAGLQNGFAGNAVRIGDTTNDIVTIPRLESTTLNGETIGSTPVFTDTVYSHPLGNGNRHIPPDGAVGEFLKYTDDGTAVWATILILNILLVVVLLYQV